VGVGEYSCMVEAVVGSCEDDEARRKTAEEVIDGERQLVDFASLPASVSRT
jgi:hypothetical protein